MNERTKERRTTVLHTHIAVLMTSVVVFLQISQNSVVILRDSLSDENENFPSANQIVTAKREMELISKMQTTARNELTTSRIKQ